MWLLALLLACGQAESPAVGQAPGPDPHAPQAVSVHALSSGELGSANGAAANGLLDTLLGQEAAATCLGEAGTGQLSRIGFTLMDPGDPLALVAHTGQAEVDDCLQRVHEATDYSAVVVPVPFQVETSLATP